MFSKLKIPVLIGLIFYAVAFLIVSSLGYNSFSFTVIAYLYVVLSVVLAVKYEVRGSSVPSSLKNIAVIVDEEEKRIKNLFTGERFEIKGEVERVQ